MFVTANNTIGHYVGFHSIFPNPRVGRRGKNIFVVTSYLMHIWCVLILLVQISFQCCYFLCCHVLLLLPQLYGYPSNCSVINPMELYLKKLRPIKI